MKKNKINRHLLSILSMVFFLILAYGSDDDKSTNCELKASVVFTGTQFEISNNDNFDYVESQFEVNDKYRLFITIPAGKTYSVGMMQFADSDGNRFNLMQKPQTVSIKATHDGTSCIYYGSFN